MTDELQVNGGPPCPELILNRPAVRNALSHALILKLAAELNNAAQNPAIRAIVVTGAPPAFCAGLDLNEVAAAGQHFDSSPLLTLLETIENSPMPVIAAINGPAMAGGALLASVCDVALCAASATIGYPGIKRGLLAPIVLSYLSRWVGERRARYLVLTGRAISANEALRMGLADEVVADAEVLPRARRVAADFAALPAAALRHTKQLFGTLRQLANGSAAIRRLNSSVTIE